jgi:hypothetical protein
MENKELTKNYIDEKTGIEYTLKGDYYIPNLVLPNWKNIKLGKYGRMRARYLKEHRKVEYTIMLIENTLQDHLIEIDKTADENNKETILKEISSLSDKIETIQAQKRACNRIIVKYEKIKEDYKKDIEWKEKSKELIIADKRKKSRNR